MKTYCVKCKKDTENLDSKIFRTKNNILLMQSTCSDCKNKKSRFVKKQEAEGLLSNLGTNTPFSKTPLLNFFNKFLLTGDKVMPEMHLRQQEFTYSACGLFTKNKERIEKFMGTGNTDFIYKNEPNKACFKHDMTYGKAKDLVRRTLSDKILRDKAFKIGSDPKYDGYKRGLASMVYKFFDIKSSGSSIISEANYQLVDEVHKPIIRKFKKRKVYASFRDNIWGVDLAGMQLLSRYNQGIRYLLCAVDLFSKYAWVIPIKD